MARKLVCLTNVIAPSVSTSEGCPVRTKGRVIISPKGQSSTISWELRFPDGEAVDLTDCMDNVGGPNAIPDLNELMAEVRFWDCDRNITSADVTVVDGANGIVTFDIPAGVRDTAGVYGLQIGILDAGTDSLIFSNSGLLSIERSGWGNLNQVTGPPTLEEIRMHVRDRASENTLLMAVEFDDAEIIDAIRWPIMQFNEAAPEAIRFNCGSFPYTYQWRNAIVGELMRTAAHHYMRNKLQAVSGGLTVDDKDKNREYLYLSDAYRVEWLKFIDEKKLEINMYAFFGSYGSGY